MPRQNKQCRCHPEAKRLCDLAKGVGKHLCHKKSNASLFSGSEINLYLQSFESGYGTESQTGITTEPNALNDDKEYLVCTNLKKYIETSQKKRKRRSDRHNPEAIKKFGWDNILRCTAVLEDIENDTQEVYTMFENVPVINADDDAEEVSVNKNKTRIGCRTSFPEAILRIRYYKRSYDLSFRRQQARTISVSQQILASCVDRNKLLKNGIDYIEKNMSLAADVVTYMDMLYLTLSSKMKINLLTIDNTECYNTVRDGDGVEKALGVLGKEQSAGHALGRDIYKEVTGQAYDRIRKRIN